MSKENPLFSIVIPTRNRADLLYYSLKSALNQDFDDYEIIVSNNASADNTKEVIMSLANDKVRYVEVNDRILYMYEHWEFASSIAKGKYITILCDDDVYLPSLLQKIANIINKEDIKAITFSHAYYYSNDWELSSKRNTLKIPIFSKRIQTFNSKEILRCIFQQQIIYAPCAIKAFYHREIVGLIRKKIGRLFYSPSPDLFAAGAVLFFTDKYVIIDEPLIVINRHSKSSAVQCQFYKDKDADLYISKFVPIETVLVPLHLVLFTNAVYDAILQLKKFFGYDMKNYKIDWANYLLNCYIEILELEKEKYRANISNDLDKFWDFLQKQPINIKNKVFYKIKQIVKKNNNQDTLLIIKKCVLYFLERLTIINKIENIFRKAVGFRERNISRKYLITIDGSKENFSNIYECIQKMPHILNKYRNTILYK